MTKMRKSGGKMWESPVVCRSQINTIRKSGRVGGNIGMNEKLSYPISEAEGGESGNEIQICKVIMIPNNHLKRKR